MVGDELRTPRRLRSGWAIMRVKEGETRSLVQPKDAGFTNSLRLRYGKRKSFYTEKGYLGLGPDSAHVGDVVCIFPGAAGLFVCREDQEGGVELDGSAAEGVKKLLLIGESYVHGIAHGEALEAGDFVLQDVELVSSEINERARQLAAFDIE